MGDDDPLDGLKAPAGEAAEKRSAKSAESGKSAESASREAERSFAQPPPAREPIADRAPVAAKDDAARTTPFGANAGRVSAPSPAKKKSAPSAPSARPEPDDEMPLRKEVDKRVVDDDASPSSSSAARNQAAAAPRAFAPPPPPASPRGAGPPPAPAAAPAPAPSVARPMVATAPSAARVKSESAADSEEAPAPRETLVQRADRLFTQGRWAEAAIAYRDLLRQRPNAPEASQWRKRLAASRAAIATGRPPSSR
jgi:hypothetical protein